MWIWTIAKGNSELAYTMRLHAKDTLALTSCSVESNDRIFPSFPLDHSRIFDSDIYVETSKKAKKQNRKGNGKEATSYGRQFQFCVVPLFAPFPCHHEKYDLRRNAQPCL